MKKRVKKRNTSGGVGKRWLLTDREGWSVRIALRNRIASHVGGTGGGGGGRGSIAG